MKTRNPTLAALAGTLCLAGACGGQKATPPAGPSGKIKISTIAKVSSEAHENTASGDICAQFTLTPYSFDASGNPVLAGSPVIFTTTSASAATDQILGCTDGAATFSYTAPPGTTDYTTGNYNWAYLVSASDFAYCNVSDGTLDTTTVNPAPAYFAPVNCTASADAALTIDYPISLSEAAPTGYVDISAGVDATTQFVGCKTAEIVGSGSTAEFHFGESNAIDTQTATPLGLIGFDNTAGDTSVAQYGGQTWAANPNGDNNTMYNTYYTGQFTQGAALPATLFQTFLTNADESHLFGPASGNVTNSDGVCAGGEWTDSRHAYCLTTGANASPLATVGNLADAFLYIPGTGFAAASVNSGGTGITLYSQEAANSGSDYSSSAVATANAAPGFASTSTAPAAGQAAFNDGLKTTLVSPSIAESGAMTITGVYIDPSNVGQFLVGETDGSSDYWAPLSFDGIWTLGAATSISAGPVPPGFGVASSGCVGAVATCPCWNSTFTAYAQTLESISGAEIEASDEGDEGDFDVYVPSTNQYVYLDVESGEENICEGGSNSAGEENEIVLTNAQATACSSLISTLANNPCQTNNGGCSGDTPGCVYEGPGAMQCVQCVSDSQCNPDANNYCDTNNNTCEGPIDVNTSTIILSNPGSTSANGTTTNTATITILDASGKPMADVGVDIYYNFTGPATTSDVVGSLVEGGESEADPSNPELIWGWATTDANGVVTLSVSSTAATTGTLTVHAYPEFGSDNTQVTLPQTATLTFQ